MATGDVAMVRMKEMVQTKKGEADEETLANRTGVMDIRNLPKPAIGFETQHSECRFDLESLLSFLS